MKKFIFLCLFAILASISAFAETTITWSITGVQTTQNTSGGGIVDTDLKGTCTPSDGGTWHANSTNKSYAASNSGAQLGAGSKREFKGTISLKNTTIPENAIITQVSITAKSNGTYPLSITVNDENFGSVSVTGTSAKAYNATGKLTGKNIVFTSSSPTTSKYLNVSAISVTYEDAPVEVESIEAFNALETGAKAKFTCPLTITASMPGKVFVQDAYGWHSALRGNPVNSASKFPSGSVIPAGLTGVKKSDNTLNITGYDETLGELTTGGSLILSNITYNQIKNAENIFRYVKISAVPVVTVYDSNYDVTYYYAYSTDVDGDGMTIYTPTVGMLENGKVYDLTGVIDYEDDHYLIRAFDSQEVTIAFDAPTISLEAGTYDKEQTVSFTLPDGATSIVYSIDDNVDLKTNGELWDGNEITINKSCTLRAIAADESLKSFGAEASATYVMKTATPTITAAEAVDGAYNNEEGKLEVTISCPQYSDNVIVSYSVNGVEDIFEGNSKVITINKTATIKATALYGAFDESDEATATFTWNNPNVIENATVTGDIVIADQDAEKFIASGSRMGKGKEYILTDIFGTEFTIKTVSLGSNGTLYPGRFSSNGSQLRMNNVGDVVSITSTYPINSVTLTADAAFKINDTEIEAVNGTYTWTKNQSAEDVYSFTITSTGAKTNISKIAINYTGRFDYYKVNDGAALIGMEKGKFYQVNVALEGVEANGGVLYARTTEASVAPSVPGKTGFDKSYEDYDLTKFNQRDWVAIKGLGSEYEGFALGTFIAAYDGEKLTSVVSNPAKSDAEIDITNINTFGAANVFYGNYENTSDFGWIDGDGNPYYPFFVKAKVNEVANYAGTLSKDSASEGSAYRLTGSGKCGVFEGKGVLLEPASEEIRAALDAKLGQYQIIEGVLLTETSNTLANGDVKIVALAGPADAPTGVAALKADGKATVYGTEGAVVVNGADGKVMIFDAMGRMVKSVNAEGAATVAMPAGYYIVRTAGTAAKVMVK